MSAWVAVGSIAVALLCVPCLFAFMFVIRLPKDVEWGE